MRLIKKMRGFIWGLSMIGLFFYLKAPVQAHLVQTLVTANGLDTVTVSEARTHARSGGDFDFNQTNELGWSGLLAGLRMRHELPVLGGVAIPSIQVNVPIMKGVAKENLVAGVGTLTPDQVMGEGTYALAGYDAGESDILLSQVSRLEREALIYLTDMEQIYVYQVASLQMITVDTVAATQPVGNQPFVTLVTMGENIHQRWVCQAEMLESVPVSQATATMKKALNI